MLNVVCLVGYGRIAQWYEPLLKGLAKRTLLVDPYVESSSKEIFENVESLREEVSLSQIELFIICSPTEDHLAGIECILSHHPEARIIVEKPVVEEGQLEQLETTLKKYPLSRVVENSQYFETSVVDQFLEVVCAHTQTALEVREIYAEFTKNRVWDNVKGRFRDFALGPLGYEGPHLLALTESVLRKIGHPKGYPKSSAISCQVWATSGEASDEGSLGFHVRAPKLPSIGLYTSTVGKIGRAIELSLGKSDIKVASSERFRVLCLRLASNAEFVLKLEPQINSQGDLIRNQHQIFRALAHGYEKIASLETDIFADSLSRNIAVLSSGHNARESLQASMRRLRFLTALHRTLPASYHAALCASSGRE